MQTNYDDELPEHLDELINQGECLIVETKYHDAQFWIANVNPNERYVLLLPGKQSTGSFLARRPATILLFSRFRMSSLTSFPTQHMKGNER
jgi:hypothetical protein